MIIFQTQIPPDVIVAVWQITENEEFFWNYLQLLVEDELKIKNMKLLQVRLQKLACRAALAELLSTHTIDITYSERGQPLFSNFHISFSHTKNSVAVALASIPVGIDIEELTPRILPLYPRFMSQEEIVDCDVSNLQELYYYWCAKEAMYKWYAAKNLDFVEDLQVYKNENIGIVCNTQELQLSSFYFENQLLVVCY
jgi:phosphopantetheinyl transferase